MEYDSKGLGSTPKEQTCLARLAAFHAVAQPTDGLEVGLREYGVIPYQEGRPLQYRHWEGQSGGVT